MKTIKKKYNSTDIELALEPFFKSRTNLMIPNVSWGFFEYECDLAVLTAAGYLYEVEIKVTETKVQRSSGTDRKE